MLVLTAEETVTLATGENLIHGLVAGPSGSLAASTRTSPAKLLEWPDPTDLTTYSVLTFPSADPDSNRHNNGDSLVYSTDTGYYYLAFSGHLEDPPDAWYIRVARITPGTLAYTKDWINHQHDVVWTPQTPAIAADATHLWLITGDSHGTFGSYLYKFLLSDGSFVGRREIPEMSRGHTIAVDGTGVYVGGRAITVPLRPTVAVVAKDLSTHTTRELSTSLHQSTDDSFVDDDYYWVSLELNNPGTAIRVAKDMSAQDTISLGVAADSFGIFDIDGRVFTCMTSTPGRLCEIDRGTVTLKSSGDFDVSFGSPNELVKVGEFFYATGWLSPAKVMRLTITESAAQIPVAARVTYF